MAGLAPMMFGLSLDFINGGFSIDSPTSLWWKQLATAVVFGLGIATVLTLVFTPSMLALRVWFTTYVLWMARLLRRLSMGRSSRAAQDWALNRSAKRITSPEIIWEDDEDYLASGIAEDQPVVVDTTADEEDPVLEEEEAMPPLEGPGVALKTRAAAVNEDEGDEDPSPLRAAE
jgi:multidrug efflux pump